MNKLGNWNVVVFNYFKIVVALMVGLVNIKLIL